MPTGPYPQIDATVCDGCGQCVAACRTGALALAHSRAALAVPERCAYCAECEDLCPKGAIGLPYEIGFEMTRSQTSEVSETSEV